MFGDAQTGGLRARRFPPMIERPLEVAAAVPEATHLWPWLALGAVLLVIAVLALASRRRPPYGK